MARSNRKKAVDYADKWYSLYVRELTRQEYGSDMCPLCGKEQIQCVFHWLSRVAYATRWLVENGIGSCMSCNCTMEYNPWPFHKWFIAHFGQFALDELNRKWHTITKLSTADIKDIGDKFKRMYEELKGIK